MKYAMVIIKAEDEGVPQSEPEREFASVIHWWAGLRASGKIIASARLAPPETASTVSWRDQQPIVTDGPYIEAKESVGGFVLLEVDSAAEAIEIARSWPTKAGTRIELRPVLET